MNIFIANISRDVNEEALSALFAEFGLVKSARIVKDKYTGDSKGFGFVEMPHDQHAQQAINALSNQSFFGKNLVVSKARPKTTV
jgi:RNA recognition motif-containing protein